MDSAALRRITEALRDRLQAIPRVSVHVGPLDDDAAAEATLVLFLYRLAINPDLRNAHHQRPPRALDQIPSTFVGSLPFDLHYLLTASTARSGDDLEGLAVLGAAIERLNAEPVVAGTAVQGEPVRISIDPITTDEMSRIWQLFPTANYRTSVAFIATPVWIDPPRAEQPAPPVTGDEFRWRNRAPMAGGA